MAIAIIALGGNLGEVEHTFNLACAEINKLGTINQKSRLYHTPAVGPLYMGKLQPDYLNAAIEIETELDADNLLQALHAIEANHGRVRETHWGARTLDLDLIAYEQMISDTDTLRLPHPYAYERLFVLQPVEDLQPGWTDPQTKLSVSAMIQARLALGEHLFEGQPWTNN